MGIQLRSRGGTGDGDGGNVEQQQRPDGRHESEFDDNDWVDAWDDIAGHAAHESVPANATGHDTTIRKARGMAGLLLSGILRT